MLLIDPTSVLHLAGRYPRNLGRMRHHLSAEPLLGYAAPSEQHLLAPGKGSDSCEAV